VFVTAIKIDEVDGYIIHGYSRSGTGKHGNDYVKIKKGGDRGKFMFENDSWESGCSLDKASKTKIEKYLIHNKSTLQQKIKDLG